VRSRAEEIGANRVFHGRNLFEALQAVRITAG
jgi:hypothetical protein